MDNVRHPAHYETCSIECIDAMRITFGVEALHNFCKMNAFKYLWRHKHKGGNEDLKKALRYIEIAEDICTDDQLADIRTVVLNYLTNE